MSSNFFNLMLPAIITSASIGTIISTFLQHYLKKSYSISNIDINRFNLYKSIFFSGVKDVFDRKIDSKIAGSYFKKLYLDIIYDEDKAILLTKEARGLLYDFIHEDIKKDKIRKLSKLQDRIQIDFKRLSKKLGYENVSKTEKIKYFIAYVMIYIDACALLVLINIIWVYVIENMNKLNSDILAILFFLFFITIVVLAFLVSYCRYYSYINKYE